MCTENYDPYYPDRPVVDQYIPVWAKHPAIGSKPAFIWADDDQVGNGGSVSPRETLTYSELDSAVQRMAAALLGGLRRGDTVLVLASPGIRLVKLMFACQRAGLVAVPVIPPDPSVIGTPAEGPAHRHLLRAVSQTRPHAAVADALYVGVVMRSSVAALTSLHWVSVDHLESLPDSTSTVAAGYKGCGPRETYLVQYTSGATGAAKPVVVTAGAAAHNVREARKAYDLHPGSVVVSWLPQYHDCGLMFLLLTVVSGATCVLSSATAFVRRPRLWLELISEFKATCTPVPSFALPLVLRRGRSEHGTRPLQLQSLRNLILVNEPIYKSSVDEFLEEFGRAGLRASSISPSYGLAENCTFVSTAWCGAETKTLPSYKKLLPSARLPPPSSPLAEAPDVEIVVVDAETGKPVKDGVEGEIWLSSPSNGSGYLGDSAASSEVFGARLQGRDGPCFVRTSDIGIVHGTERYLYVLGRTTDVILSDIQRPVPAHYIETAAFESSPGCLRGGCIVSFTTRSASPSPVVVVAELQQNGRGGDVDMARICDGIRQAVWREVGVSIRRVVLAKSGGVPKTTSGKLQRGAARAKLLTGKLPKIFEARYAGLEPASGVVMARESTSHRVRLQSPL
uniref:AMP-dependent synthetase/ligase domain-containing protein n=1 Tax=Leersia perrieri TaxID=77586 RepID=A0A0D9V3B9_9ORYZ